MEKIQTAEEFLKQNNVVGMTDLMTPLMIEFAKMHVEAALKEASEKAVMYDHNEDCHYIDEEGNCPESWLIGRDSILKSYPLDNIK